MNKKMKIMLSSIATIAMTASLAIGGTYALFTSEDKVNIAVTSGAVDVRATTSELTLTSNGVAQSNGTFAVGGTATKVGNDITLDKMVPMDKVDFTIDIDNYSNVAVQYRTVINMVEDTGLFSALKVTFVEGGVTQTFTGGYAYGDWKTLTPTDGDATTKDDVTTIAVSVEFPDGENQNQYQNKTCKFAVTVEAVQGNASVVNPITKTGDRSFEINSEEGMMLMNGLINSTSHGEGRSVEFKLAADMDMTGYAWTPARFHWVTLDGNGKTISNLNCAYDDWGRSGFAGYAGGAIIKNVTFKNVTSEGTQAGIVAGSYEGGTIENVTIAGTNVVKYNVAINPQETWGGVGAVAGVAQYITTASSVTIANGATVKVDYNNLITSAPLQNAYAQGSDISAIVTNNGTVTEVGSASKVLVDGLAQDAQGNLGITSPAGFKYLAGGKNTINTMKGATINLLADLDFEGEATSAIPVYYGYTLTFNGNGHTISNVKLISGDNDNGSGQASLFYCSQDTTLNVSNLKIDNATVSGSIDGSGYAGVVVGYNQGRTTLTNVDVTNSTVNGEKSCAIMVGFVENATKSTLVMDGCDVGAGCSVTVVEDRAGAYVGRARGATTITNCTVADDYVSTAADGWANKYIGQRYTGCPTCTIDGVEYVDAYSAAEIIAAANAGDVIVLSACDMWDQVVLKDANGNSKDGITLKANGEVTLGAIGLNSSDNVTIDGFTFDAAKARALYSTNTKVVEGYANITDAEYGKSNESVNGLTIKNCTFTGTASVSVAQNEKSYSCISFESSERKGDKPDDITIEGCKFYTTALNYIRFYRAGNGTDAASYSTITIKNNVFGGDTYTTTHHAIQETESNCHFVVEGNKFYNWAEGEAAIGISKSSTTGELTLTVKNNTFSNTTTNVDVVYLKSGSGTKTLNTFHQVSAMSGNIYEGALAGYADPTDLTPDYTTLKVGNVIRYKGLISA